MCGRVNYQMNCSCFAAAYAECFFPVQSRFYLIECIWKQYVSVCFLSMWKIALISSNISLKNFILKPWNVSTLILILKIPHGFEFSSKV